MGAFSTHKDAPFRYAQIMATKRHLFVAIYISKIVYPYAYTTIANTFTHMYYKTHFRVHAPCALILNAHILRVLRLHFTGIKVVILKSGATTTYKSIPNSPKSAIISLLCEITPTQGICPWGIRTISF